MHPWIYIINTKHCVLGLTNNISDTETATGQNQFKVFLLKLLNPLTCALTPQL